MKLHTAGEDYLEAVLILQKKLGMVRSVDVARYMEVSKPSVCYAVGTLREGGFLTTDEKHYLHLTERGWDVAEKIYERHCFLTKHLISIGVDGGVDDPRPQPGEVEGSKAHPLQRALSIALTEDVAVGDQGLELLQPGGVGQVQPRRELPVVDVADEELGRRQLWRGHVENVCAVLRQGAGAGRAGQDAGQVQGPNT